MKYDLLTSKAKKAGLFEKQMHFVQIVFAFVDFILSRRESCRISHSKISTLIISINNIMDKVKTTHMKGINVDALIGHVFKLWMRTKKQILDEFGLTGSQYEIMSAIYYLGNRNKEIIQIDLADQTGIDPMTVSTILRNLEKNNIITRVRGTVNTRVIYVQLTEKGIALYNIASSKMSLCCNNIYRNIDEKNLTSQLLVLSNELNKLNN